jgi:hypothetical protein
MQKKDNECEKEEKGPLESAMFNANSENLSDDTGAN